MLVTYAPRRKVLQKTRVARMVKSALAPKLEIADPRKFEVASNLIPLDVLCGQIVEGRKGMVVPRLLGKRTGKDKIDDIKKILSLKHTYFLHLTTAS